MKYRTNFQTILEDARLLVTKKLLLSLLLLLAGYCGYASAQDNVGDGSTVIFPASYFVDYRSVAEVIQASLVDFGLLAMFTLLAFSGASSGLIRWATSFDLAPVAMLLVMFGVLLLLGMFMEQISMMLLTVPIFFPLATTLGFDPVWFGLVILLALEISFTTPPFGLLLFVMKGVAPKGTTMREIYGSAFPYMGCSVLLVFLLILFPQLALWLPGM